MTKNIITRRIISLILIFSVFVSLTGCGKKDIPEEDKVDVLLITDIGTINDGSFNESAWAGVLRYADGKDIKTKYYQPDGTGVDDYLEQIEKGVDNGAQVIVCPGYLFEEPIYEAQSKYTDTKFIILDGAPHNKDYSDETIGENVMAIEFAEEEAGFLVGYAAVRDGYTNLAFMGGIPEDTVIRYGYGFVQGADYAAIQMGTSVSIRYTYCNTFFEDESVEATASSWYDNGTEVIFACGGAMGKSVIRAAENHNGKVIGVDVDQSDESDVVITSALKNLDKAVLQGLESYYDGTFTGGNVIKVGAANGGVGLEIENSHFRLFDFEQYQQIYTYLMEGYVQPYAETNVGTCEELTLVNTEVNYIVP